METDSSYSNPSVKRKKSFLTVFALFLLGILFTGVVRLFFFADSTQSSGGNQMPKSRKSRAPLTLPPERRLIMLQTYGWSGPLFVGNRSASFQYIGKIKMRDDCGNVYTAERDKNNILLYILNQTGDTLVRQGEDEDIGTSVCFNVLTFESAEKHSLLLQVQIWPKTR